MIVLDNQLRAKVDDGKSYVHYGCYEAMQPAPVGEADAAVSDAQPLKAGVLCARPGPLLGTADSCLEKVGRMLLTCQAIEEVHAPHRRHVSQPETFNQAALQCSSTGSSFEAFDVRYTCIRS